MGAKAKERQVTGALKMLNNMARRGWIGRNYHRMYTFTLGLCRNGGKHNDEIVQRTMHSLFMHSYPRFYCLPLSVPVLSVTDNLSNTTNSSTSLLTKEETSCRNNGITLTNKNIQKKYLMLIGDLVEFSNTE